jgi:hypothetical protein
MGEVRMVYDVSVGKHQRKGQLWRYRHRLKSKFLLVIFSTEYHAMKAYLGSGGIAPHILDLGARWR